MSLISFIKLLSDVLHVRFVFYTKKKKRPTLSDLIHCKYEQF